jgi:hypothetical protein
MKSFVFAITLLAAACTATSTEIAVSAREDARDAAMAQIVNNYQPNK